ncbi:MAG: DUF3426 domain-containing protein [Pseudomonadales bacterium]|jgi:predicted Zn finger-like uncharacterized protein|nr:DUF3426 domain-containing protein [Gammaproteobacteria bacterium]MBP6053781.1 DUF3426 domain-containing protein [Pseudomonadales bacterium]
MISGITRCPACGTTFRVSEEQLDAAEGRVRCGACDQVFDARAHQPAGSAPQTAASPDAGISQNYIDEMLFEGEAAAADQDAATEPFTPPPIAPVESFALPPIAPQPVEMERGPVARRWQRLAWTLACLLALLGLVGQYAWHNRDTLALDPRLRPAYALVCERIGCVLPSFRDFARIRSEALHIRPAPGRPGLLLVDALLSNHAPFAQDFPGMEIVFSDMRGRVLASRLFLPHEYLDPQDLPLAAMPPREPVSAHLEIVDPGEDATNYQLYLREIPPAAD